MKAFVLSFSLVLFFAGSLFAETANKNAIIENMIEAYGGEKALDSADSYIQHWKVIRTADGAIGKDIRRVTLPNRLYVDLKYPDREETRALEGNIGIKIFNRHNKRQVFGPMLDAMKLQLMRLYNPLTLRQFSKKLQAIHEKPYYILILTKNGVECDYYVNPKNFHIEKTVGKLKMNGNTMEFVTLYDNFVKIGDVLMPGKEIKYAGSENTATNLLKDTKFIKVKKVAKHRYERI